MKSFEELSSQLLDEETSFLNIPLQMCDSVREFHASISLIKDLNGKINRIVLILMKEVELVSIGQSEETKNGNH